MNQQITLSQGSCYIFITEILMKKSCRPFYFNLGTLPRVECSAYDCNYHKSYQEPHTIYPNLMVSLSKIQN